MSFISYNAASRTYTIDPGAATADIQDLLDGAAPGTTFHFTEGTHVFTDTLRAAADGISLTGAGRDKTTFVFDYAGTPGDGIHIGNTGYKDDWMGTVTKTVKAGATTITLDDASALSAGDLILVRQKNSRQWLDENGYENVPDSYIYKTPINESLVEIQSVSGNVVTLAQPLTHDMNALDTTDMTTTVRLIDAVHDVTLADFSMKFTLGESNPDSMTNTQPDYVGTAALRLTQTVDAEVRNIGVDEAPSTSLEFHTSLRPHVDNFSADGAHNKGSTGDGYGLHISETHYGTFENLTLTDMRHALVFSAWHTDVANQVHILSVNRDINYHGGPDYDNVVIVERAIYRSGSYVWPLVSPGDYHHPPTDIDANTTLFGVAQATGLADEFHGWDSGAWLDGAAGDDIIHGGAGNDVLIGGRGADDIYFGGGSDIAAYRPGGGGDDIFGFGGGDKILLDGFSGVSAFSHVSLSNVSGGAQVKANGETLALLHGVSAGSLSAANFIFNDGGYFTPPPAGGAAAGVTVDARTGTDNISGTGNDDTVNAWMSQLGGADRIALGGGADTLCIRNGTVAFDSADYPLFSGIDILDITAAGNATLVIRDAFVAASDSGRIVIEYSRGLKFLDASGVHQSRDVILAGAGTVNLSDSADIITAAGGTTGRIYGKGGNDILYGSDGVDLFYGGAGADYLDGGRGADQLSGGGGKDIFLYRDILEGGDIISDFAAGDVLNLGDLFTDNGLGGKSAAQAQADGNLLLRQNGADAAVSFDADGAPGSGTTPRILATLLNTAVEDIGLAVTPASV